MGFKADQGIDDGFLYHFLRTQDLASLSRSTTIPSIRKSDVEDITISLPPLAEQKRIVQKLDALLAQVDTLKARIDAIPALLKRFRSGVLSSATSGRLTQERRVRSFLPPLHRTKISDCVIGMKGGASPSTSDYSNSGTLALNKGDIKEYGLIGQKFKQKFLPQKFIEANKEKLIKSGSLLVTLRDLSQKANFLGLIGKYRGESEALITQGMYLIELDHSKISDEFLILVSNSPNYRQQVKTNKVGATQVHLRNEQFLALEIPDFSTSEQTEIVRRVEQLFAYADQLEAKVAVAQQRIDALTQSLLAKAFRGELVPQDPTDEPASVLLERIRAQRAATPKPKRGRKAATS